MDEQTPRREIIRFPEVHRRVQYSRQHIDRLEHAGLFPKRFKLSPLGGRAGAVAWFGDEIDAYIAARAAERVPA